VIDEVNLLLLRRVVRLAHHVAGRAKPRLLPSQPAWARQRRNSTSSGFITSAITYGSLKLEQGENIKYIQVQMEHSDVRITINTYAHLFKDTNPAAAKTDDPGFRHEVGRRLEAPKSRRLRQL
jgi:hypothetical protein